jgi:hypothetical protein
MFFDRTPEAQVTTSAMIREEIIDFLKAVEDPQRKRAYANFRVVRDYLEGKRRQL